MTDKPVTTPSPGSYDAIEEGCLCPVLDNNGGEGIKTDPGVHFWINDKCAMHGYGETDDNR